MSDVVRPGVEVVEKIDEAQTVDFDLLYLSEYRKDICDCRDPAADARRATLPRRIVVGRHSGSELELCAVAGKELDTPEPAEAFDRVLDVYDAWIAFLLGRRGLKGARLSLYFDDNDETRAAEWANLEVPNVELESSSSDARPDSLLGGGAVGLWRHTPLEQLNEEFVRLKDLAASGTTFYQECTYSDPFFAYLSSVRPEGSGFEAKYLCRQLIEMGLCRSIVIDERVARTTAMKTRPLQSGSRSLGHILAWMGIAVVGNVRNEFLGEAQRKGTTVCVPQNEELASRLPTLVLRWQHVGEGAMLSQMGLEFPKTLHGEAAGDGELDGLFPADWTGVELLTVHQSLLETRLAPAVLESMGLPDGKIPPSEEWRRIKGAWSAALKPSALAVYSHSGCGHPLERLPENVPFMEYSLLLSHVLTEPSKFFFVQFAMASKEQETRAGGASSRRSGRVEDSNTKD